MLFRSQPFAAVRARMEASRPGVAVLNAYLELTEPQLDAAVDELAARGFDRITIVPMFLARGGHLRRDLPALVESLQRAHPGLHLRTTPAIGEDGDMLDALAQWAGRHGGLPWDPA